MDPNGATNTIQDFLPLVGTIGAPGLICLFFLLVFTGRLVPRSVMNERVADKQAVIDSITEAYSVVKENNELLRRGNETAVRISQATAEVVGANPNE